MRQLEELSERIIDRQMHCFDWTLHNLLVQKRSEGFQLKLIDFEGKMGNRELIPISTILNHFGEERLNGEFKVEPSNL